MINTPLPTNTPGTLKTQGSSECALGTLRQVSLPHLHQALGSFGLQCGTTLWQRAVLPETPAALQSSAAWVTARQDHLSSVGSGTNFANTS